MERPYNGTKLPVLHTHVQRRYLQNTDYLIKAIGNCGSTRLQNRRKYYQSYQSIINRVPWISSSFRTVLPLAALLRSTEQRFLIRVVSTTGTGSQEF